MWVAEAVKKVDCLYQDLPLNIDMFTATTNQEILVHRAIFCAAFADDFIHMHYMAGCRDKHFVIAHPVDHCMLWTRPCFALIFAVEGRLALLNLNLKDVVHTADCDLEKIAELTEGYSGADITNVCRYVSMCIHSESHMIRYLSRSLCRYFRIVVLQQLYRT